MRTRILSSTAFCACLLAASTAPAAGFQVNHYEPTTAGEWGFMVDKPWYSSTRNVAIGVTGDYAHSLLVTGTRDASGTLTGTRPIIEHAVFGHVDLGFSLFDRVTVSGSMPALLWNQGEAAGGIAPLPSGVAAGDPRVGLMLRLYGHSHRDPISVHVGGNAWIPLSSNSVLMGDDKVRVLPKLVLAGYANRVQWSLTGGYLFREAASIGNEPPAAGNSVGDELQVGAALAYADFENHFTVGPEALLATSLKGGHAFESDFSSLQLLLGFNINIAHAVQLGIAGGTGLLQQPGNPDVRGLLRIAYAPIRSERKKEEAPKRIDSDGDGIFDDADKCPTDREDSDGYLDNDGCPEVDNDGDTVLDATDNCPNEVGPPENVGCPDADRDGDGFVDRVDQCVNEAEDKDGFEDGDGCPDLDNDIDGVPDGVDRCPNDLGTKSNDGCPDPDRDGDTVIDRLDNCPDEFGSPANQGCAKRQLAKISEGRIEISQAVFFTSGTANIGKVSFAMLNNVASILKTHPEIDVTVEGHTDNVGQEAKNKALSQKRADAVKTYLVKQGVAGDRIKAQGFGSAKPVDTNATKAGRAKNRRVVFSTTVRSTATKL